MSAPAKVDLGSRPRLARELRTVRAMLVDYCRAHHGADDRLCEQCSRLFDYATDRLDRCAFQERKPTCANCPIHCYAYEPREQMKEVMRFAGPRIIWRHPVLAALHLVDGFRKAPGWKHRPVRSKPQQPKIPW